MGRLSDRLDMQCLGLRDGMIDRIERQLLNKRLVLGGQERTGNIDLMDQPQTTDLDSDLMVTLTGSPANPLRFHLLLEPGHPIGQLTDRFDQVGDVA